MKKLWRKLLGYFSHEAAMENFYARFCPHGIVDTGICEECEAEAAIQQAERT